MTKRMKRTQGKENRTNPTVRRSSREKQAEGGRPQSGKGSPRGGEEEEEGDVKDDRIDGGGDDGGREEQK